MRAGWLLAVSVVVVFLAAGASASAATGGSVTVWDTSGERRVACPPIEAAKPRAPRGGCVVETNSRPIDIVIRSVVGDMEFGTCVYDFDLRVDGSGLTYLENIVAAGPSPCNDMKACDNDHPKPWRGQIEAGQDGRLTHVVDACFDTCMGQFVGKLELDLERVGGRWALLADRALVGGSGYRLDGGWDMEGGGIDFDAGASGNVGAWRLTAEPVGWPI
jgi:hypothetical protein